MATEADELRRDIRDLCERRARGDINDRRYDRRLTELSVALCRRVVEARLVGTDETILAEHHLVYSHFKLNQSLLHEPEQATASFFATEHRLIRVRGTQRPLRPVSCDDADGTVIDELAYAVIRQLHVRRELRKDEAIAGAVIMLGALLFGRVLQVTGRLLVLLGFAGVLHALLLPTRWIEIESTMDPTGSGFQIHGVRRKSARRLLAIVRRVIASHGESATGAKPSALASSKATKRRSTGS
jgi:hypothetical protein